MNTRISHAIEKLIYWRKVYEINREKLLTCTAVIRPDVEDTLEDVRIHLLSSTKWLEIVYEEETGKKITKIGNLPEIKISPPKIALENVTHNCLICRDGEIEFAGDEPCPKCHM